MVPLECPGTTTNDKSPNTCKQNIWPCLPSTSEHHFQPEGEGEVVWTGYLYDMDDRLHDVIRVLPNPDPTPRRVSKYLQTR